MAAVNSAALVHDPAFPLAITPETQGHAARESRSLLSASSAASIPVVGNFSPAPGGQVTSTTPIQFDVTDAHGFRHIIVYALAADGSRQIAYDGADFRAPYTTSSMVTIANGFRFSIARDGGWTTSPQISVVAVNQDGVEATA